MDNYKLQMKMYTGVTYKYKSIYRRDDDTYFYIGSRLAGFKTIRGALISIGMRYV